MSDKLGIIAGGGLFPILAARNARAAGRTVVVAALRDNALPTIKAEADRLEWVSVTQVGHLIEFFRREGVTEAIMAGSVDKKIMYSPAALLRHVPDARALKVWYNQLRDHKDASILLAVISELAAEGIEIVSSIRYLPDCLAADGVLTRRAPTEREQADVEFGRRVAATLADLDVGQSIIVKEKVVVAVEAVEGTDETIRRGGALAGGEAVLIKVSRTHQDVRFDIPTTGIETVTVCHKAGISVIALEAGGVLMLEREAMIAAADKAHIAIVGTPRLPEAQAIGR